MLSERTAASANPFLVWDEIEAGLYHTLEFATRSGAFVQEIAALAESILALTENAPDAAMAGILLKDASRYACIHSLHVAVLAAILAHRLSWPLSARRDVVRAALSMNVAIFELQSNLQHQREPLTDAQQREVTTHPQHAYQFLFGQGGCNQDWLEAVRLHHEQIVLPAGAPASAEGRAMSQLLRILDVFCAKISGRSYRRALLPALAVREILVHERQTCSAFVQVLLREIGLYMPGSLVQLANGETAVVVERSAMQQTPQVAALPELRRRDTSSSEYQIVSALSVNSIALPLDLATIWGR